MVTITLGANSTQNNFEISEFDLKQVMGEDYSLSFTNFFKTLTLKQNKNNYVELQGSFKMASQPENAVKSISSYKVVENGAVSYTVTNAGIVGADVKGAGTFADYLASNSFILNGNAKANTLATGDLADTLDGAAGNDKLFGLGGKDKLNGGDDNDLLDGGTGNDEMTGGKGDDTFIIDNSKDTVIELKGQGTDIVKASVSVSFANLGFVESVILTGSADAKITGDDLANSMTGNSGDNFLDGGKGADQMAGGKGDDTYVVDNAKDTVTELKGQGDDEIQSGVSIDLNKFDYIETVRLTGTGNVNATGDEFANKLYGNSGKNILDGGKGADELIGGKGDDTYVIDNAKDEITEAKDGGHDKINATIAIDLNEYKGIEDVFLFGSAKLNLTGDKFDNILVGNDGKNVIAGGLGDDTLTGGKGADIFVYKRGDGSDTITDFNATGEDKLSISGFGKKYDYDNIGVSKVDKDTVDIDLGNGDHLIFDHVRLKDVDLSDFLF
ncbi:calcium-binding protein [Rhizobium alvei]|uniref:Calcium-binding protein n=1 Tax=Rhizobium alvei TaxID=1132659 RepID=A0ABT8YJ65_9HYPH|nr:calcium-binding protein [Rhizobium alvei]MDO6963739.1 calcium-binding protein [Rhizobium alvei]